MVSKEATASTAAITFGKEELCRAFVFRFRFSFPTLSSSFAPLRFASLKKTPTKNFKTALGVATGWLLNRYARESIDKAYKKFKAAL